jgi:hypothetical protein
MGTFIAEELDFVQVGPKPPHIGDIVVRVDERGGGECEGTSAFIGFG